MKENSIREDIKILKDKDCFWKNPEKRVLEAIEHVLSDYKRVLKENETNKRLVKMNLKNAEELEDIMNKKNYTITELVQYVLQELIEGRE